MEKETKRSEWQATTTTDLKDEQLLTLNVDDIVPNPNQPRQHFDEEELQELAESIRAGGLKVPIKVREIPLKNGKKEYELIDGERRWRAFKFILKWQEITAIIDKDVKSQNEAITQSLVMNLLRSDVPPQDKEAAIYKLCNEQGLSTRDVAKLLGKRNHSSIDAIIEAYKFRQKLPPTMAGAATTTSMLKHTSSIKDDDNLRIDVLKLLVEGTIKQADVRDVSKVLRESPPQIRQAVLEEKKMTIEEAREARSLTKEVESETNSPVSDEMIEEYLNYRASEKVELKRMKRDDKRVAKSILKGELGGKARPPSEQMQEHNRQYDAIAKFHDVSRFYSNLVHLFGISRGKHTMSGVLAAAENAVAEQQRLQKEWMDILKRVANDKDPIPGGLQEFYELNEIVHRETGLLGPIIEREIREQREDLR